MQAILKNKKPSPEFCEFQVCYRKALKYRMILRFLCDCAKKKQLSL